MREILFRGKDIAGNWHYGVPLVFSEDYVCMTAPHTYNKAVEANTVGQYTGLPDKNGKMIFEGDICKHRSNYSGEYIISVVTFTDGQFLAMASENSGFNLSDKLEIIGNIHDNPELLERSENGT
jgi:uncharacterized phage protein (TIGR01671 family)